MTMSQRDRRAILLGSGAILFVAGYLYVVSPWLQSWSDARQRLQLAETQRAALVAEDARLESLRRTLGPFYGSGLGTPLPPVAEVRVGFVKTVQELLKQNGLESRDVRSQPLQPLREVPGVGLVALEVDCQGQVQGLMQALTKLSQAERPIVVQRMNVEPDTQRPDQMRVSLTLATFAKLEATP